MAMSFDLSTLKDNNTPEERAAEFRAGMEIARKVKNGQLTRQQGIDELVKRGDHPLIAGNFLMHQLDQNELNEEYRRTGLRTN